MKRAPLTPRVSPMADAEMMPQPSPNPFAAPSKPRSPLARKNGLVAYNSAFDAIVTDLRYCGVSDQAVARILGVTQATLQLWLNEYPSFSIAWEQGGEIADSEVARALFRKATGYVMDQTKVVTNRKTGEASVVHYSTYMPPDTPAAIFWLTNRQPERWKSMSKQEHTGPNGAPLQPPSLSIHFISPGNRT